MNAEVVLISSQVVTDIISDPHELFYPKLQKLFFGVNHNFTSEPSRKFTDAP